MLTVSFLLHPLARPCTLALVPAGVGAVPELIIGFPHYQHDLATIDRGYTLLLASHQSCI